MNKKVLQHCAKCGSCTVVCPVYRVTGRESLTARGKLHLLGTPLAGNPSRNYQDIFASCLLCGACENACPGNIRIRDHIVEARAGFPALYGKNSLTRSAVRTALAHPKLLEGLVKAGVKVKNLSILPAKSGLRLKLGLLEPKMKEDREYYRRQSGIFSDNQEGVAYFPGCLARYLQPGVAESTNRLHTLLAGRSLHAPETQVCCGLAARSSGSIEEARRLARKNIAAFEATTGPILTSCASCSSFLQTYPELLADDTDWQARAVSFSARVKEFSSYFMPAMQERNPGMQNRVGVYYHEPCHLRFDARNRQATLQLLDQITNVDRLDSPEKHYCCGQGGLFHICCPELSDQIFSRAYNALPLADSVLVITTCSGCLMQWQAGLAMRKSAGAAKHLADFLLDCLERRF